MERLETHLRKLKKDELALLVERVESGTVDFTRLIPSGEGGFGFQEHAAGEMGSGAPDREDQGVIGKAQDLLADARGKLGGGDRSPGQPDETRGEKRR